MQPMKPSLFLATILLAGAALLGPVAPAAAQQQPGQGMMGPGMMGPGMMGGGNMGMNPGCPMMGQGMGAGMMGQGMMGRGTMDHPMMGMMHGAMRPGMADGSFVMLPAPPLLSVDDVTYNLERLLAARDNPHLKLGTVAEKDAETLTGEIVTTDGSLVERYEVDKRTGVARLVP